MTIEEQIEILFSRVFMLAYAGGSLTDEIEELRSLLAQHEQHIREEERRRIIEILKTQLGGVIKDDGSILLNHRKVSNLVKIDFEPNNKQKDKEVG